MNAHTGYNPYADEVREAAGHVLAHFEGEGPPGGSFTTALLEAFTLADLHNRAALARAFPILGQAFVVWREKGPDALRKWGGLK